MTFEICFWNWIGCKIKSIIFNNISYFFFLLFFFLFLHSSFYTFSIYHLGVKGGLSSFLLHHATCQDGSLSIIIPFFYYFKVYYFLSFSPILSPFHFFFFFLRNIFILISSNPFHYLLLPLCVVKLNGNWNPIEYHRL
jgi:hypothetical protein